MSPADSRPVHPPDPPPANPEVREALDRHEDEAGIPEAEEAASPEDADPMEGGAPTG